MDKPAKTQRRTDILRRELDGATADLEGARASETWHALARLRAQVLELHAELLSAEAAERDAGDDDLSPEELEAEVVEVLRGMPRDLAQRLMDEAHPPPGLRVVNGGAKP